MNKITFQHPDTKERRITRDFQTARALMSQGWRPVPSLTEPIAPLVGLPDDLDELKADDGEWKDISS